MFKTLEKFNSRIVFQVVFDDLTESEYLQDDLMMILEKCSKERHASEFTIFDNDRFDKKQREIFSYARNFLFLQCEPQEMQPQSNAITINSCEFFNGGSIFLGSHCKIGKFSKKFFVK